MVFAIYNLAIALMLNLCSVMGLIMNAAIIIKASLIPPKLPRKTNKPYTFLV